MRPGSETFRNPYLEDWNESKNTLPFYRMTTDMFPRGIVSTPFKWEYFGKEIPMHFYAGFMAVSQDPNLLSVRPVVGWAVVDDEKKRAPNNRSKVKKPRSFLLQLMEWCLIDA